MADDEEKKAPKEVSEGTDKTVDDSSEKIEAAEKKTESVAAAGDSKAAKKAAKKANKKKWSKKKLGIVWGTVAVVLIAAGCGMWTWHEQPSFCGQVCHKSMAYYYQTYSSNDSTYLASVHATSKDNVTCLDCHQPVISQQISEVFLQIGGKYELDSQGRLAERRTTNTLTKVDNQVFCLKSGCHDFAQVQAISAAQATADGSWDPHTTTSPHGATYVENCSNCHRAHEASTLICASCHDEAAASLPDGWVLPESNSGSSTPMTSQDERPEYTSEG